MSIPAPSPVEEITDEELKKYAERGSMSPERRKQISVQLSVSEPLKTRLTDLMGSGMITSFGKIRISAMSSTQESL